MEESKELRFTKYEKTKDKYYIIQPGHHNTLTFLCYNEYFNQAIRLITEYPDKCNIDHISVYGDALTIACNKKNTDLALTALRCLINKNKTSHIFEYRNRYSTDPPIVICFKNKMFEVFYKMIKYFNTLDKNEQELHSCLITRERLETLQKQTLLKERLSNSNEDLIKETNKTIELIESFDSYSDDI